MRFLRVKTTILALATALAAGFAASSSSKAAPEAVAACPLNFTALKVSNFPILTVTTEFTDVPESAVRFVQGGSRASCVVVSISANASSGPFERMFVRAVLDGRTICHPNESFFGTSTPTADVFGEVAVASAVNYVCTGVTPGPHTIKLQLRSTFGRTVGLDRRTVTVHHFK